MRDVAINLRALTEQRELVDQVIFYLDTDKFKQFNTLLEVPFKPNPGLERLMAVKAPWSE